MLCVTPISRDLAAIALCKKRLAQHGTVLEREGVRLRQSLEFDDRGGIMGCSQSVRIAHRHEEVSAVVAC